MNLSNPFAMESFELLFEPLPPAPSPYTERGSKMKILSENIVHAAQIKSSLCDPINDYEGDG